MEATASIIAILQLSEKVIKYVRDVSGATDERKRLREQVRACSNILLTLRDGVEDSDEGQVWAKTVELLASPLERLQRALELAAIKLQTKSSTKEKLKWPFKEKEVQKLIDAIESEKSLLVLSLENNSARLLQQIDIRSRESDARLKELNDLLAIQNLEVNGKFSDLKDAISVVQISHASLCDGVSVVREHQKTQESSEERQKILDWLSPVDHFTQQHDKISRRQAGTCNWFLESQPYQTWFNTAGQTLFCPGIPGAGKTILSSVVVADLWGKYDRDNDVAVTFFYCDFRREHEQTITEILLSILKQLVQGRPSLSKSIGDFYNRFQRGYKRPLREDIIKVLQTELSSYSKVFVLVDALDECAISAELLPDLFDLQVHCKLNLLATSRPIPDIISQFEKAQVNEVRASKEDVGEYLDAHIRRLPRSVTSNPILQAEVRTTIIQSVEGMFLLAKLHLESLVGKRSIKAIRDALRGLITGSGAYDSAYTSAMERIESQVADQAELAKQVLAWIVHAKRQITTFEIQEALGVEIGERVLDRDNCPHVDDMVSVCAGLVTIDEGSSVIRLVHYTTQEYFDRTRHTWFPHADAMITSTCTTYLSFDACGLLCDPNHTHNFPMYYPEFALYEYAAQYWGEHAALASSALTQVLDFLRRPKNVTVSAHVLQRGCSKLPPFEPCTTNLHLAAYFGLCGATCTILEGCTDPDPQISDGTTPLMIAAFRGHESVVKVLLDRNAAVDQASTRFETPLKLAAEKGHNAIVDLLLKSHAAVDGQLPKTRPLHFAARNAQASVVGLLLKHNASVTAKDERGKTALHYAARSGSCIVMEQLLIDCFTINVKDSHEQTPLHEATCQKSEAVVRLLLGSHANFDAVDHMGMTALHLAASNGDISTGRALLEYGADTTIRNKEGHTALEMAVCKGQESSVKLLLDAGDDVNSQSKDGKTPLHLACDIGSASLVVCLLDAGADVNWQNNFGVSPLHRTRSEYIAKILLEAGADLRCVGNFGSTPLHSACMYQDEEIVKLFLDAGAEVNCQDDKGITPLHYACREGCKLGIIRLLLEAGAEVNCYDKIGWSPLSEACWQANRVIVKVLLGAGAEVHCPNNPVKTLFDIAHYHQDDAIIELLLEYGARQALKSKTSSQDTTRKRRASVPRCSGVRCYIEADF